MISNSGGKVSIHTDNTLYDKVMNASLIMKFTLSVNDKVSEKEKLIINNIVINKGSDIKVDGYSQEFNVSYTQSKLDDVCTLDSITVEKELIKDFSKEKTEYRNITVTNEIIFIDAVRTSSKSSATGLGNVKVPKGETIERDITVTAEDGSKKIYKLFITNTTPKEEEIVNTDFEKPDEEMKSIDNSLKTLELYNGNKKINFDFNSEKDIYNIELDVDNVSRLTIKATLNDSKASFVKNYGPRDIIVEYGYNKELIKVLSESGNERIITLNINYLDNRDKDNELLSLKINGEVVDLTKDKLEITLPSTTLKTIIEAIPSSATATVKYEDVDLVLGDNLVKIEVTSEDGQTNEYDVNVIRENMKEEILSDEISPQILVSTPKGNTVINIICYIVFGIGILLVIAASIYCIRVRRN